MPNFAAGCAITLKDEIQATSRNEHHCNLRDRDPARKVTFFIVFRWGTSMSDSPQSFPFKHQPALQLLTSKMFHSTSQVAMPLLCNMGGPGAHSFQKGSKTLQAGCKTKAIQSLFSGQPMSKYTWFRTAKKGLEGVTIALTSYAKVDAQVLQNIIICLQPVDASMFARKPPSNPPTT